MGSRKEVSSLKSEEKDADAFAHSQSVIARTCLYYNVEVRLG